MTCRRWPALLGTLLLTCLSACPSDDAPGQTETGSETSSPTGDGDGDGDGDCSTPGVYGDCAAGLEACMSAGPSQCVLDSQNMPSIAVCGRPCTNVCDCWAAPADGDAQSACTPLAPGDDGTCILDCSGDAACPTGMICTTSPGTEVELCVFPQ